MIEAFSYAREYWAVGLWVNASNLQNRCQLSCDPDMVVVCVLEAYMGDYSPCKGDLDVILVDGKP